MMTLFPHSCGADLAQAVQQGADPRSVVPDSFVVVHGGKGDVPIPGSPFSASVGPTLEAAAAAVPHGQIRTSTVGAIRQQGGSVVWLREVSRRGTLNEQHVEVTEVGTTRFSELQSNPVPRKFRIDGT